MRQFLKRILSAASLITLLPTVILAPYAAFVLALGIGGLFQLITAPPASWAAAAGSQFLLVLWPGGYFLSVLVYLMLLFPLPRIANFVLWCVPVVYLLLMLWLQPWINLAGFFGPAPDGIEGLAQWAMASLKILLPLALLGLWMERPRRRTLPPPFPGSVKAEASEDSRPPQALPFSLILRAQHDGGPLGAPASAGLNQAGAFGQ